MLVVVVFVGSMPVAVVNVVDVITVRHCHMPALVTVCVAVVVVHDMLRSLALVEMALMSTVEVPVMDIVDMVAVRDCDVAAPHPMYMVVSCVFLVCNSHRKNLRFDSPPGSVIGRILWALGV